MRATDEYLAQFDLTGQVAVVTGGSEGIGLGVGEALGAAGARVAIASRTADKVAAAAAHLAANGIESVGVPTDVRDEESVARLFAEVLDQFGRVDILVNSAGGAFGDTFRHGPLASLSADDFVEAFRANVVGALLCSQAAAPIMNETGGGAIVHISSGAGRFATPHLMGAYGASKAALNNLTRTMALEFAPTIRVNAILPGHVDTPRTSGNRTPERARAALLDSASGRLGTPADIGYAVCFLCSPAGSWVNAILLDVNGGDTRRRD
jgi:NAD(P)-dependent dehydrogenase (short-subunit alcohol dehydrogenase family)